VNKDDQLLLLGEFKQFMTSTSRELKGINHEIRKINQFRWRTIGALGSFLLMSNILIAFILKFYS